MLVISTSQQVMFKMFVGDLWVC